MTLRSHRLPLAGRRIGVPESRELDILQGLLERRGAAVLRCPLVSIIDAPDAAPVLRWLDAFIANPPDYFILMTGEGLARLCGFAMRGERSLNAFRRALQHTQLISRGPKPARELRQLGLVPDFFAPQPTTHGIIDLLQTLDLRGQTVAVQLYGDEPNEPLMAFLQSQQVRVSTVAPYRYVAELANTDIAALISQLATGGLDAMVFTSQAQVDRLFKVAGELGMEPELQHGLAQTCVAAVGPLVQAALTRHGCQVNVMPTGRYFMKPLVQALSDAFALA